MNEKKIFFINLASQILLLIINVGLSLLLVPFITNKIGSESYAFVTLGNDFINYAQIITIALNSMATRFILVNLTEKKYDEANKFYSSVMLSNIVLSLIIFIIFILVIVFLQSIINITPAIVGDVKLLWSFLFINFIVTILTSIFTIGPYSKNKTYICSLVNVIGQVTRIIILILLYSFLPAYIWYVGIAVLICNIIIAVLNYHFTKKLAPELKIRKKDYSWKHVLILLKSGIWNSINKISNVLSSSLDLLICNIFVGSVAMGTLAVSKTLPNQILAAFVLLSSIFAPSLTINYAKKDYLKMKSEIDFSSKILALISCIPITILFVFGKEFYSLWIPTENAIILRNLSGLFGFGLVFSLALEPMWYIFTATNKIKESSIFLMSSSFITLLIVFVLFHFTQNDVMKLYIIAGVGSFVGLVKCWIFLPLYSAKCLKLPYKSFYPMLIKITIVNIICIILAILIKMIIPITNWITLIIACIILGGLSFIINLFIILNKEDRITILSMLKKRRLNENNS